MSKLYCSEGTYPVGLLNTHFLVTGCNQIIFQEGLIHASKSKLKVELNLDRQNI